MLIALGGCSSTSTSPAPPTPVTENIVDPTGDTCGTGAGQNPNCSPTTATGTTIYDITGVTVSRTGPPGGTYNMITVTYTMVQPVVLPAAGAAPDAAGADLVALTYFDTDGNVATGTNFTYCGAAEAFNGVDYVVNASTRLADGNYNIIVEPAGTPVGEATVAVNANTVTFGIPISVIGNHPAGPFNFGSTVGNSQTPSDCAANTGFTPASIVNHPMAVTHMLSGPWWKIPPGATTFP